MERPAAVTGISVVFYLIAAYLFAIGVAEWISPGTVSVTSGLLLAYGRDLDGPQSALLVGAGWTLVAWGLFKLRNWARWAAMALMVIGVAGSVPAVSAAARNINWRFFWYGGQMMAKVAIGWYLAQSPEVIEAFVGKKKEPSPIPR